MAARLARLFNEGVMGLLALVAMATALGSLVFDVSAGVDRALTVVEWVLVGAFAAEFVVQGAAASDRRAWMRSPWRIVDAVTILGPVVALLPQVSDVASGTLMLRMLRLGRAVAFGTRAGAIAVRTPVDADDSRRVTTPKVSVVRAEGDLHPVESDWGSVMAWTAQPGASWFHVSDLYHDRFSDFARDAGVSDQDLAALLGGNAHAKLRQGARNAILILQMPTVAESNFPDIRRDRLLAIITDRGFLTATTGSLDLQKRVMDLWLSVPEYPFPIRIACALLSLARERNQIAAQRCDDEALDLELLEGGKVFLNQTYLLRREMTATALDLWHLKGIVGALANGKATLPGMDLTDEKYLDDLATETESLYETVNKSKEVLESLIDLHINVKSFEMNKFLKLLAVVSFMGLIPSIVGGLLGMNVLGEPWPVTLGQVAFGVAMGMATALYVFAVKGWLR